MIRLRVTVLEIVPVRGLVIVACDVVGGEIRAGMVLDAPARLASWRVTGVVGARLDLDRPGRRGLGPVPLGTGGDLAIGDVLCGAADGCARNPPTACSTASNAIRAGPLANL